MIRRFLVLTATLSLGTLTVSVARPLTQTSPQPPAQGSSLPSVRLNRAIELLEQDKPIFGLISADRSLETRVPWRHLERTSSSSTWNMARWISNAFRCSYLA